MGLVQKSFSDIITFSRTSNATRVGPTGVLEYAPHNLMIRSQEMDNAAWTKDNCTATANAIAAPDGTVTADLITDGASGFPSLYLAASISITAGVPHTASGYLKRGNTDFVRFILADGSFGNTTIVWFNLADGTASSGGIITSVGNGWYRFSVTATIGSATTAQYQINTAAANFSNTRVSGGTYYLWGAQLAVGPYALDYTPTTSAAVYGPRFDYDGSGVTIVEPVSRNLLTYSEQFDSGDWITAGSSVIANQVTSPIGIVNADQLTESTASSTRHGIYQIVSPVTAAAIHTFSVYVKNAVGTRFVRVAINGATPTDAAVVDVNPRTGAIAQTLSNGVTNVSSSVSNVGNGWYRVTITGTIAINYVTVILITGASVPLGTDFGYEAYTADNASGVYLWGAQLEVGSTATAYMVSGASNGFRAVPVVSGSATPKGLLVEEQRQNLLQYSEQFDNAYWTKGNSSVTANAVAAPDGTTTADKLVENSSNAEHLTFVSGLGTGQKTVSVFLKSAERTRAFIYFFNSTDGALSTFFDLSAGTVTSGAGAITAVGNGWYRCTLTRTATATDAIYIGSAITSGVTAYAGNGTSGIYLWGAQLEAGSFATSYIPTLASAVTRSADVASVNTLSPWYSSTGTIYSEIERYASGQNVRGSIFHDGTTSNFIGSSEYTFGGQGGVVVDSGVAQVSLGAGGSSLGVKKLAFAFGTNDFALSENGGAVTTDTSGTVPTVTTLGIGSLTSANVGTGYIRRIAFYPRRLTNAELQALSA